MCVEDPISQIRSHIMRLPRNGCDSLSLEKFLKMKIHVKFCPPTPNSPKLLLLNVLPFTYHHRQQHTHTHTHTHINVMHIHRVLVNRIFSAINIMQVCLPGGTTTYKMLDQTTQQIM